MFHARGPAAAKDRSPSDDIVRGTATELDVADLNGRQPNMVGMAKGWPSRNYEFLMLM